MTRPYRKLEEWLSGGGALSNGSLSETVLGRKMTNTLAHVRRYDPGELEQKLRHAGVSGDQDL